MFLKGKETIAEPEGSLDQVTSWQSSSNQPLKGALKRTPSTLQRPTTYCPKKLQAVTLRSLSTAISLADQAVPEHTLFPIDGHTSSFIPVF
ncbi:hypothetical protein CHARACLAT_026583 [Characodon lateralis]|uniref:Uncharacterized protein n=1 Tax=Characodon lateralis TaxID=208331 RepID=A0ABU7E3S6_9TELE|nr:hypothetical protein [Characodon lateralis]